MVLKLFNTTDNLVCGTITAELGFSKKDKLQTIILYNTGWHNKISRCLGFISPSVKHILCQRMKTVKNSLKQWDKGNIIHNLGRISIHFTGTI